MMDEQVFRSSGFLCGQPPLEEHYEIRRLACVEVTSHLPTSPYHSFGIDQDWNTNIGALEYQYILANPLEMDSDFIRNVFCQWLTHLKEITTPQIQPLVSMNPLHRQQVYKTITYGVEDLFEDESDVGPLGRHRDNCAGGYIFHPATPVATWYKRELLMDEWCERLHHISVALHDAANARQAILKVYVDDRRDLSMTAVNLVNMDGTAERYENLMECFRENYPVKRAITTQLTPMVDTIVKSVDVQGDKMTSNEEMFREEQQMNREPLFGPATPVPRCHNPTDKAENNRKWTLMRLLHDSPNSWRKRKLDPVLEPSCFKKVCEEPGTAPCSPVSDPSGPKNEVYGAQMQDLITKAAGKLSIGDRGESGFISAGCSSSFNQANRLMQVEKQLSREIEAERYKTERMYDADESEDGE